MGLWLSDGRAEEDHGYSPVITTASLLGGRETLFHAVEPVDLFCWRKVIAKPLIVKGVKPTRAAIFGS